MDAMPDAQILPALYRIARLAAHAKDPREALRETLGICSRAYIISEGRVLAEGTPQQIVENVDVRKIRYASVEQQLH